MICDTCIYSGRPTYKSPCSECNMEEGTTICEYEPVPHTPTNADRVRAMSDEELQKFLCHNTECGSCRWCQPQGCTLDEWLQQPAEEA